MKNVLAVLAMCLCLAGCQVAEPHREASFDYNPRSDVPDVKWPSMFDYNPRETPLSYSLAWDTARFNAWDVEPTHCTGLAEGLIYSIALEPTDSNVMGLHFLSYAASDKATIVTVPLQWWPMELRDWPKEHRRAWDSYLRDWAKEHGRMVDWHMRDFPD